MRAATQLDRVARHLDDADDVAVLLPEQHHRAELSRLVDRRLEDVHGPVLEDELVHASFDGVAFLRAQRAVVREVEAQLVRPHRGARLANVLAERVPQRLVEQVRTRVVRHRREAHRPRHARADAISGREPGAAKHERLIVLQPVRLDEVGGRPESSSSSIVPASVTCPPPAG